jgi:hypothetical protein
MGFGGWWVAYFLRPVFIALVLSWLWRILLLTYCFWRVGPARAVDRADPSRPDRRTRLRRGSPRSIHPGDLRHLGHDLLELGPPDRRARRGPGDVQDSRARVRAALDALPAAAPAGVGAIADSGAPAPFRCIPHWWESRGGSSTGAGSCAKRWMTRRSLALRRSGRSPTRRRCTTQSGACGPFPSARGHCRILVPIALPFLVVIGLQVPLKDLLLKLAKALV